MNISIVETDITRYDTWIADEMFLTGTAAEIIPIVEVDSRSIGVGRPGAITARFIEVFKSCVSKRALNFEAVLLLGIQREVC